MLYDNEGAPLAQPDEFPKQEEHAYQTLSGVVDELAEDVPRGAILMALTRLQFEQNGAMVLEMVEKMLEKRGAGGGEDADG
jgi:hypothetical protein